MRRLLFYGESNPCPAGRLQRKYPLDKMPRETENIKISEAPIHKELFAQQTDQMDNVPAPGYNNVGGTQPDLSTLDVNTASWDEINSTRQIIQARENAAFDTPTVDINTPEREQLRQQIADDLMQLGSYSGKDADGNELFAGPVRRERRADIVIGPPAAGKSSVLANPLSEKYGSRIIDSDMAKARLPEFNGGLGASMVHEESAKITEDAVLSQSIYNGDNIVIPWVGKSPQKLRDALSVLKQSGYTVHLSLNELDPDKAAQRAVSRFVSTGRFVDPNYVLSVGWKPSEVYELLKQEGGFDSYVKYSNDVPYGSPAKLIERIGQDSIQDGGMGGYGGGLRSFGTDASKEAFAGRGKVAPYPEEVIQQENFVLQSDAIPLRADGSASVSAPADSGTPSSVGALESNPARYSNMQNTYGTIAPGENPSRVVDVPTVTNGSDCAGRSSRCRKR